MKKVIVGIFAVFIISTIAYFNTRNPKITIEQNENFVLYADAFQDTINTNANNKGVITTVNGTGLDNYNYHFYYGPNMQLMAEGSFYKDVINSSFNEYADGNILIEKGNNKIETALGSNTAIVNGIEVDLKDSVVKDEELEIIYIPINEIAKYLNYSVDYYLSDNRVDLVRIGDEPKLPSRYDMRDTGRVTAVKDQGRYGTCWAFASLGAVESTLMPLKEYDFSPDHMSLCNSYSLGLNMGGAHTMSIAYLAAWQGPVLEKDDPYGDGITDDTLEAVVHLEEAIIVEDKDLEIIKSAIYRYGAVETSMYMQMPYWDSSSYYYNDTTMAYCYIGDNKPNHDVIVVGWDDDYPKENFSIQPERDGAFICRNSWGKEFGEDGYFYVSYYDSNICNTAVIYSKIGDGDNFDKIYQSDLLGFVGQMGFGKELAYFANVYTAGKNEELSAVSFYATGPNTTFDVYVVNEFTDIDSLKNRDLVVSGETRYSGYYTARLPEPVRLEDNKKFAVVVKINTPDAVHPIAIEYNADGRTESFDVTDGEGYVSLYGELWHNTEQTQDSNVCLKAFTNKIQD